jgi:hypothetical protein
MASTDARHAHCDQTIPNINIPKSCNRSGSAPVTSSAASEYAPLRNGQHGQLPQRPPRRAGRAPFLFEWLHSARRLHRLPWSASGLGGLQGRPARPGTSSNSSRAALPFRNSPSSPALPRGSLLDGSTQRSARAEALPIHRSRLALTFPGVLAQLGTLIALIPLGTARGGPVQRFPAECAPGRFLA